jgi:hypothetical protein
VQELGQKNDDLGRKTQTCNTMFANEGGLWSTNANNKPQLQWILFLVNY